jgi:hypothetical protein
LTAEFDSTYAILVKRIVIFLASLLFLFFIFVPKSHATLPCIPEVDPWFSTKLVIPQSALPKRISIIPSDYYSIYELESETLENLNTDPFYVVGKNLQSNQQFPGSELPRGYEPKYKIASGKVYYYQNPDSDNGFPTPQERYVFDYGMKGVSKLDLFHINGLQDENVYQDNRPNYVTLPPSQRITIYAYYKGKYLEIPGELHYFLNKSYNPHAEANSCKYNNNANNNYNPFERHPIFDNVYLSPLIAAIFTLILIAIVILSLPFLLVSLVGQIIGKLSLNIQKHSLFALLMIIFAGFIIFDAYLFSLSSQPYITIAPVIVQLFSIYKVNNKIYALPTTNWRSIFIKCLLTFGAVFILFFLFSIALSYYG